jgi:hypothetical protein
VDHGLPAQQRRQNPEHTVRGYAANDPQAIEALQDLLVEATRAGTSAVLPGGQEDLAAGPLDSPRWPEICRAVVAFQRGQGVNMNLVGPFKGKGYFCLLPADRPAIEEDVRRFALHTTESLRQRLEAPTAPLISMPTHRQGFRQKREVVSLLRRAGFGSIAPRP